MATIEHQLTEIYVFVDDYLTAHARVAFWRRSPNARPAFTDAEVITVALAQGCFGCATLSKAYTLVADNYRPAFPRLPGYAQWIARVHALSDVIGRLVKACCVPGALTLYVLDSKPLPLCRPIRNGRVRLMREDGAYFGISSIGWFFGFKLHAIINVDGCILDAALLPANRNDRDVAPWLGQAVDGGIALVDNGYRSRPLADVLADDAELLLIAPKDAGSARCVVSTVRERIETVFSKLWAGFIDRIHSRSWLGLWTTTKLKLLYYNMVTAGLLTA